MLIISHRGNLNGPNEPLENEPDHISGLLDKGMHVEIDVWYYDGKWFIGHDYGKHKIPFSFLFNRLLWCHAKNNEALFRMNDAEIHCFWHNRDNHTTTSRGFIWTHPDCVIESEIERRWLGNSILVLPETSDSHDIIAKGNGCYGICTDYPDRYRK